MLRSFVGASALVAACVAAAAARPAPQAASAPDRLIVFASDRAENLEAPELFSVSLDGRTRRNLTRTPKEIEYGARVSPDGRWLLFRRGYEGDAAITVARTDGSESRAVAFGSSPTWSPDGERISYDVGFPRTIHLVPRTGAAAQPLTTGVLASWSPDGTRLAFVDATPTFRFFVIGADGTGRRPLGPALAYGGVLAYAPQWSRDGRRVAVVAGQLGDPATVTVVDADTGETESIARGSRPRWSPDGKLLAFDNDFDLYTMRPDGSRVRRLTDTAADETEPAWSPDGRRIAFVRELHGCEGSHGFRGCGLLYVMNANGSGARRLTTRDTQPASSPAWSPDGGSIAFVGVADGDFAVYRARSDGRQVRRLPGTWEATRSGSSAPTEAGGRSSRPDPGRTATDWQPVARR